MMIVVQSCIQSWAKQLIWFLREISQWFYPLTIFAKAPSQMLNYAQKTSLILYNTSYVIFFNTYCIYHCINSLCVLWINCVKNLSVVNVLLKFPPYFLRRKLYALVYSIGNSEKTSAKSRPLPNILQSLHGQLLMVRA